MRTWVFLGAVLAVKVAAAGAFFFLGWRPLALGVFVGADVVMAVQVFGPRSQLLCPTVTHFATNRREVWLTIDDGPDARDTPRILELLERHGARATFFLVGQRAAADPGLVEAIRAAGHELGSHTLTHPVFSFWCAGRGRTEREVVGGLAPLAAGGEGPRRFRSPVGFRNFFLAGVLRDHGLRAIGWTIRSDDVRKADPSQVVARVAAQLRPGAIILMHQGQSRPATARVQAIGEVLEVIAQRGYRCVVPPDAALRPLDPSGEPVGAATPAGAECRLAPETVDGER